MPRKRTAAENHRYYLNGRDRQSRYTSKRRKDKRVKGLCAQCPLPSVTGKSLCITCAEKHTLQGMKRRQTLVADGRCISCAEPGRPGFQLCAECAKGRAAYQRQYQLDHPDAQRQWYQANIHHARALYLSHARKRANLVGFHTVDQWLARVAYYGWRCAYCGQELTMTTLNKDHVIAVSRGGTDWPANLVPACRSCNSAKNAKYVHPCAPAPAEAPGCGDGLIICTSV